MSDNKILKAIKTALGMEVELEQMKLVDGQTILEADSFESGKEVFVVTPDGNVPVPVGEYELESGQILSITQEGVIAEIKDAPSSEENPEEQKTEPAEEMSEEQQKIKRTIESVVKETVFSKVEEIAKERDELATELAKVKEELALALTRQEELELSKDEPATKPISHNPENTTEIQMTKIASKRARTTMDSVLEKLSKN